LYVEGRRDIVIGGDQCLYIYRKGMFNISSMVMDEAGFVE
jgi:CO dehydrogenase/acetyl-CoA synthase gamma subunit (corrinoid Fe-S protein)